MSSLSSISGSHSFQRCDANNLLSQLWTWEQGNISDNPLYKGDFEAALKAIKARTIILPVDNDRYFPPVDAEVAAVAAAIRGVIEGDRYPPRASIRCSLGQLPRSAFGKRMGSRTVADPLLCAGRMDLEEQAPVIGAKAVKSYLTFAIVVFAASPACARAEPARAEKAYLQWLLAHALDAPSGDEKSVLMMVLDKCAQELQGYMDECDATGATNCLTAASTIARFAFRSTRK
jgi:hypothetical protein